MKKDKKDDAKGEEKGVAWMLLFPNYDKLW